MDPGGLIQPEVTELVNELLLLIGQKGSVLQFVVGHKIRKYTSLCTVGGFRMN